MSECRYLDASHHTVGMTVDMWGAYNGIAAQGFQQDVANHQYTFVNPNASVTTNHVEAM